MKKLESRSTLSKQNSGKPSSPGSPQYSPTPIKTKVHIHPYETELIARIKQLQSLHQQTNQIVAAAEAHAQIDVMGAIEDIREKLRKSQQEFDEHMAQLAADANAHILQAEAAIAEVALED